MFDIKLPKDDFESIDSFSPLIRACVGNAWVLEVGWLLVPIKLLRHIQVFDIKPRR